MKCPRCGKPVPAGASFCMHCGQALAATQSIPVNSKPIQVPTGQFAGGAAIGADAFDSQRKRLRTLSIILGLLAIAILVAVGLQASGFLRIFASAGTDNALQKRSGSPPPALEKTSNLAPPALEKTATKIEMPQDVRDWLEHLHQTEIACVEVTNGNIAQAEKEKAGDNIAGGVEGVKSALDGVDDPNAQLVSPVDHLAKMVKAMHDQMYDLKKKFDAYPAPAECVPIQAAYDQAMGETADELGDLGDHLAAGDIAKLQSMEGTSTAGIDAARAKTDRMVGEICDKYQTKKWFSITKDIAPGGVLALPGF